MISRAKDKGLRLAWTLIAGAAPKESQSSTKDGSSMLKPNVSSKTDYIDRR